jgi:broad specificity phosphatase PhoE
MRRATLWLIAALLMGLCAGSAPWVSAPVLAARAEPALKLYLARHGQTDWNLERRLQGGSDIPLNATGRQQAADLKQRLHGVHLDAIYSSALKRSRETAEIVHGAVPLVVVPGLNERRLGAFEGRTADAEYDRRSQDPDDALDGGESASQFFARIQATLAGILARHRSGAILIVGHGATNQTIVRALAGLSPEQARAFEQANDDLYLCEIKGARAQRFWKFVDLARPH